MITRQTIYQGLIGPLILGAFLLGAAGPASAGKPARYNLADPPSQYVEYRDAAFEFMAARYPGRTDAALPNIVLRPDFRPRGFMVYRTYLGGTVFVTGDGPEPKMVCTMVNELTHHFDYYNGRLALDSCAIAERRAYTMKNRCLTERYGMPPEDVEAGAARSCASQAKYSISPRRN